MGHETATFTEPTTALRDWIRTLDLGTDVYAGGLPAAKTEGIVITRIGGPWLPPIDDGSYQFDCWAATAPRAATIAGLLVTALTNAAPQNLTDTSGIRFCGLGAVTALSLSDPNAPDRHRTVVTAEIPTKTTPT